MEWHGVRENSSHIMRRVQTTAMDGIATEDTVETIVNQFAY
jgi:hypothetical protein